MNGKKLIRISISLYYFTLLSILLIKSFFPENSLGYKIAVLICFALFLSIFPMFFGGILKLSETNGKIYKNKTIFWLFFSTFLGLDVCLLILTIWMVYFTDNPYIIFIPLFFFVVLFLFMVYLLKSKRKKDKIKEPIYFAP